MSIFSRWKRPWLARDYAAQEFLLDVEYLVAHLDPHERGKAFRTNAWQDRKTAGVLEKLDAGKRPGVFDPIRLVLHAKHEEFRVEDGISRIRAFHLRRVPRIRAIVRPGVW